jgi:phenylalanyl-tRNA synthetase alpha chain
MTVPTGFPDLDQIAERIARVPSLDQKQLEAEEIALLGRKSGVLTLKAKSLGSLPLEQRKSYGAKVNELKVLADAVIGGRKKELQVSVSAVLVRGEDLTLPGRRRWVGAAHPVTRVVDEIVDIFRGLGFTVAVGPEVETDWFNFTALNFPADHPAMDMHDTLYVDAPPVPGERGGRLLLRTHTSPVQIRTLLESPPPVRVVIPGLVYRNDPFDPSHAPAFSQIEGLAVDEGISFVDL